MGLSRRGKVFPGPLDVSLVLELFPKSVLSLATSLPHEDQEILVHLVAWNFALSSSKVKGQSTCSPKSSSVSWQKGNSGSLRQRKVGDGVLPECRGSRQRSQGVGSTSRPDRHARLQLEVETNGRRSFASPCHTPILGCNCFECYSSFWSRWNTSPNLQAIADILDTLDEHVLEDPSWQNELSETLGDMDSRRQHATENRDSHERLQDESQPVTTKPGKSRRTSANQKRRKKEAPRAQNECLESSSTNVGSDNFVADGSAQSPEKTATTSPLMADLLDDEKRVVENILVTAKIRSSSRDSAFFESIQPKGNSSMEASDKSRLREQVGENDLRLEQSPRNKFLRGQGFLGRFFPDALGDLAERLWDVICPGRTRDRIFY